MKCPRLLVPLLMFVILPGFARATPTAQFKPFTATYKVMRKGSFLGTSTLTLRQGKDGVWTFSSSLKAESGIAAMLGGKVSETSSFRLVDGHVEALRYTYRLDALVKHKQRDIRVDWKAGEVVVSTSNDGNFHYKTQPGLVERHLLALAVGQAVAAGRTEMTLPVAGKDHVEAQSYAVHGHETTKVPAGELDAVRVDRTHDDKGYSLWYAPARFGIVPVKVEQKASDDMTMLLQHLAWK